MIKGAASQRQQAEGAPQPPVSGEITGSEWIDVFPKQEKRVKKPTVVAAKPNHAAAENKKPAVQEDIKVEVDVEEESKPYFSDNDDIKRGIIAAEILNRKY